MRNAASVRFGEFYLLPAFQRHGIGSTVLASVLACADAEDLPVELEYLKWNPVGSLYQRFGFVNVGENEIHYFLVRERAGENPSLMRASGGAARIDCATLFPSALFKR
jgi:GNAT superfamily N-acetyltransferase